VFLNCELQVKPLDQSHELLAAATWEERADIYLQLHDLPMADRRMIFLRPTEGVNLLLRKWIEEMKEEP
jgi:hypothetical protein